MKFENGHAKMGGRTKGVRDKLSKRLMEALEKDFQENGEEAVRVVRKLDPSAYLKIIAALAPKELEITDSREKAYTDEQLDAFIQRAESELMGGDAGTFEGRENKTAH